MESPGTAKTLSSYRYIFVVQELPNFPIDITQSMFAGCLTHTKCRKHEISSNGVQGFTRLPLCQSPQSNQELFFSVPNLKPVDHPSIDLFNKEFCSNTRNCIFSATPFKMTPDN